MSERFHYSVFLSCGSEYTGEQEKFVSALRGHLSSHGCESFTVGKTAYSVKQPVKHARDIIANCDGMVVVAFERIRVDRGREKPGSNDEKPVDGWKLTTVWNHMEAAMAYAHDLPILAIVEKGLHREGMISTRFEWVALEDELSPDFFNKDAFIQTFGSWLDLMDDRKDEKKQSQEKIKKADEPANAEPHKVDFSKLSLQQFARSLSLGQISALILLLSTFFGAGVYIGSILAAIK